MIRAGLLRAPSGVAGRKIDAYQEGSATYASSFDSSVTTLKLKWCFNAGFTRAIPLLMLHGKKDKTLRYEPGSATLFTTLSKVPRALVTFPDKGHIDILSSPSFLPSVLAFLDMELRHDDTGWRALTSKLAKDGDASIEVGGGLAPPS